MSVVLHRTPSLVECATLANREHKLAEKCLADAVAHAFTAGDALNTAFALIEEGQWTVWLAESFEGSESMARLYRRMATYRAVLVEHGITTVSAAQLFLAEARLHLKVSTAGSHNLPPPLSAEQIDAIRRLSKTGLTQREIARVCGVSRNSVQRCLDSRTKIKRRQEEARRRRRRATEALRQASVEQAARRIGGDIGQVFSTARKLAVLLDTTIASSEGEQRRALKEALAAVYRAEDAIGKALRAESGDGPGL